ncbi:DUF771 domain-containing protein [Lactobacillus sp. ESL0679]|uniref:DUF771 domain-containing protein n=1 Tax=Lactobacillus sp. ESL0679 TaxID=2983209 RepID=UPI0023F65F1D|nr:DUF771 domain-containing protein [Lactobacillus sp. ESL0679]MDF7683490.1 DUF771 domain-containing protein [Lactobacillus sp. ESL0679]
MQIPVTKEERKAEFIEFAKEFHLVPEDSLTGRTIGIDEFAKKYCKPHGKDWVKANILYKFEPDWCQDIHPGPGHGFTIFEKSAAKWMEEHRKEIDWNAN